MTVRREIAKETRASRAMNGTVKAGALLEYYGA